MISRVVTIEEGTKDRKCIKTKIGVGSLVKAKVGNMEDNKSEGIIRRIRKDVVGYVQYVVGKKNFLVQFEDWKNR